MKNFTYQVNLLTITLALLSCSVSSQTIAKDKTESIQVSAQAVAGCQMEVAPLIDFGIIYEFPPYKTISDWDSFPQDMNWYMHCTKDVVFTVQPFTTETWVGAKASKITGIKLTNQTNPSASYPLSALIMFGVTPEQFVGGNATLHHTQNPYRVITADGTKQKLKAYMFLENIWKVEGYSPTPGYYTGSTVLSVEY